MLTLGVLSSISMLSDFVTNTLYKGTATTTNIATSSKSKATELYPKKAQFLRFFTEIDNNVCFSQYTL